MGCASGGVARENRPEYRNRRAESLFQRSKKELKKNEFTPAITDLVHAELLVVDEELKLAIISQKEDTYNHILIQTGIEDGASLKYTLLYKRDDVFYPVENMPVGFTFLRGNGIMPESVRTSTTGTALAKIEKITTLKRKLVIESVPMVTVENEKIRIEELKYQFIVANTGEGDEIILESVGEAVDSIVEFFESLFNDIFHGGRHHHMR
jgi:hypothetical protein